MSALSGKRNMRSRTKLFFDIFPMLNYYAFKTSSMVLELYILYNYKIRGLKDE